MPVISPQTRPQIQAQTEDSWRAPHRTIQAKTMSETKALETPAASEGQQSIVKEGTPKEEKVTLSPQLTALARKEQSFRKQEQAHKAQVKEFEARQTEFQTKQAEVQAFSGMKDRLAKKDYSVLDEMNVSYEEWTQYLLSKGDKDKPEVQELNKLRDEVNSLKTRQEENVNKQFEATKAQYRKEIKDLVAKDPRFETVKELKMEEDVLQHILDTFNEDGEALSVEEAAQEVEDFRTEEALKMARLKKVQEKIRPKVEKTLPPPKPAMKTLTNQIAPQSTKTSAQFQHLSPRERIAQAIEKSRRQQG